MRFVIGLPIVLSIAAFVLAMLALFAGKQPGFMEDFDIIRVKLRHTRCAVVQAVANKDSRIAQYIGTGPQSRPHAVARR